MTTIRLPRSGAEIHTRDGVTISDDELATIDAFMAAWLEPDPPAVEEATPEEA